MKYLEDVKSGFSEIKIDESITTAAYRNIESWLTEPGFSDYTEQIKFLIEQKKWDFLLDSFYQIIPFGTGGRRGLVGIGTNRINPWTILASAQGHSQYLLKQYGDDARERGLVITYDVRVFSEKGVYNDAIENPVMGLSCKDLAFAAAEVYTANGIKVYIYDDVRSTPQLSFSIRHLNAISGVMFSASHNLPTDNGKKVYDEHGGQLIPPFDQELVDEVTKNVTSIERLDFDTALQDGKIIMLGEEADKAYHEAVLAVSQSDSRNLNVLYSPLHGTGITTVYPILKDTGFDVSLDPKTSNMSGAFENVTFNIPNPEVHESFNTLLESAETGQPDILMNTDPDADRIGVMVLHNGSYQFLNGNEIGIILSEYGIGKAGQSGSGSNGVIIKTGVTTSLVERICQKNSVECIPDLLVGFKYIGEEMNKLEQKDSMVNFILGTEESHGYIIGDYAREKDAACAAVWIAELAAELKEKDETLVDYLQNIYSAYGYCHNYLTEIRLTGAKGMAQISQIMNHLRTTEIDSFGDFSVSSRQDYWQGDDFLSETDKSSRNVISYRLESGAASDDVQIKVVIRPSGTEPKVKLYIELLGLPFEKDDFAAEKKKIEEICTELEKTIMMYCYDVLGVDFPSRGFLLFWQLPLDVKMRYFDIENDILQLSEIEDKKERKSKLEQLLSFLGSNPVQKVDKAFRDKYSTGLNEYLNL